MKRNFITILSLVVMSLMFNATGAYAQSFREGRCAVRLQRWRGATSGRNLRRSES